MKKNYFFIVFLFLANIFSTTAKTNDILSAKGVCNITITVDKASNVIISTQAGHGQTLSLTDGNNTASIDDSENPLQIAASAEGSITSLKVDGSKKDPSGDGIYRIGITNNMKVEITTKSLNADPAVEFSVTNPAHIIVKADDQLVADISSPKTFTKGCKMSISAATDYEITRLYTSGTPSIAPDKDGVYSFFVNGDLTVYVESKAIEPVVTFDIDYPNRVKVFDNDKNTPIDISKAKVSIAKGTILKIEASAEKYTIESVLIDGVEKTPAGGSNIYYDGVTADKTIAIKTSSTIPAVRFVVDNSANVKVYLADSKESLDVTKTHELEKNTQIVIESTSDATRIASVTANGLKLIPAADGKYATSVSTDMAIEIKTRKNLPVLTFNVDASERINVWNGTEKLDISDIVEITKDARITIESAAENFKIKTVMADNNALTADADGKYHATVAGDMVFEISTAASLTLHITQPEGGKISVFRDNIELKEGDKVNTNEVLVLENKPDEGYVFTSFLVNQEKCTAEYTVTGSNDITLSADFRKVKEGYVLVTFDIDDPLINVREIGDSGSLILNIAQSYEIKKGNEISLFIFSKGVYFKSCTANGVDMKPDADNPRSYRIKVEENMVIKATTETKVYVTGDLTMDDSYKKLGDVFLKFGGEEAHDFELFIGETVELIAKAENGYEFDYFYSHNDLSTKFTENTYTVKPEDLERTGGIVVIKAGFKLLSSINNISSDQGYYDAEAMQIITTGGDTKIYTISGNMVMESSETNISTSTLNKGIYIVKNQDKVFKLTKK